MPRAPRNCEAGGLVHVIARFVDGEYFLDSEEERRLFLARAGPLLMRSDWIVLGYALMSSHIHWVLWPGLHPFESIYQPLHTWFAGRINRRRERFGPVFAGRPRTLPILGTSAAALLAYVHNNPVRAGVVRRARQSTWTSHRAYAGIDRVPEWLAVGTGLRSSGYDADHKGRGSFDRFVDSLSHQSRQPELSVAPVPHEPAFDALGEEVPEPVRTVVRLVAEAVGLSAEQLCTPSRKPPVVEARRLALLVWTRHLGGSTARMAAALRISSAAASYLLRKNPRAIAELEVRASLLAEGSKARLTRTAAE